MKTLYRLLLFAFCLLMVAQAYAQIEVRLEPVRKDFVVGEAIAFKITITNHTDATIPLRNTPGRPWLNVALFRRGEHNPISPHAVARFPEITLTPGSSRSFQFNIGSMYRISTTGGYYAIATVRMPDGHTTHGSNRALFATTNGGKLRDFNVSVRGQSLNLSLRLTSVNGRQCIFGQVKNIDTNQVIRACFLAEYLNFMRPSVLLDGAFNMHVLCQSTPEFYTYAIMDTHGKRTSAKLYKRSGETVDLIGTGKGIFPIGLTPYVAPEPGKENIHKASERPF